MKRAGATATYFSGCICDRERPAHNTSAPNYPRIESRTRGATSVPISSMLFIKAA